MGKNYSMSQFKEGRIVRTLSGSVVNFGNVLLVLCVLSMYFHFRFTRYHQFVTVQVFPLILL